jgi:hypothetical protein
MIRKTTKLIHEGKYAAEVPIELDAQCDDFASHGKTQHR